MSECEKITRQEKIITYREELYKEDQIFTAVNKVWIKGMLEGEFEYTHTSSGINFYENRVEVKRWNIKNSDFIPIMVAEIHIPNEPVKGKMVEVGGYFYSCSRCGGEYKNHLKLYVCCKKINFCDDETIFNEYMEENAIYLEGKICQQPVFRKTLLSDKKITDLMITTKRGRKMDLIPCIAWNDEAEYAKNLNVGDIIKLYGRIQHRTYPKRRETDSIEMEKRDVYEISIMEIKKSDK